jgi:hypothetical protein
MVQGKSTEQDKPRDFFFLQFEQLDIRHGCSQVFKRPQAVARPISYGIRFTRELMDNWMICTAVLLGLSLIKWYRWSRDDTKPEGSEYNDRRRKQSFSQTPPHSDSSAQTSTFRDILAWISPLQQNREAHSSPPHKKQGSTKPYTIVAPQGSGTMQPYDAFLVLDVEATCQQGTDFNYPNEIIVRWVSIGGKTWLTHFNQFQEFPVCLMRWKDKTAGNKASQLKLVDEFRSFVKPTWRPKLSQFCMELTGITQVRNLQF